MPVKLMTTKNLAGRKVYGGKKARKIGKVHRFIFHPTEKRLLGFTVKRPDAALMFHRKDLFVALNGFDFNEDGSVLVHDDPTATDKGACKALGVKWDACVLWIGMPVMTKSGEMLGYVGDVSFDCESGAVHRVTTEKGVANDVLLGKRAIPAKLVKGFRIGQGVALAPMGEYGSEDDENSLSGAILVSDEALDIPEEGGAAAAAGKATAVAVSKAKASGAKARAAVDVHVEKARPTAKKVAQVAGDAVDKGTFVTGRQIGRATGMFSAFKEEFDKASRGEE